MSSFFSFLPADGWQRLMCDALWQSTLIAGLGWLAARFLVRQSAARAWLMLMTLIACAIVPLASMAARHNGWTVLTADNERFPLPLSDAVTITSADVEQFVQKLSSQPIEADPSAAAVLTPTDDRAIDELNAGISSPAAGHSPAAKTAVAVFLPVAAAHAAMRFTSAIVLQILGTIWLAFSILLLARLILAITAARRTMRNAVLCNDATLLFAAAEAARRIGVQCPAVFFSRHVETPTILAFRRSRLLVPPVEASLRDANTVALSTAVVATPDAAGGTSRLGETRPPIDWIAAFSHELAHVARGDGWSRLAVECICIALPLQPLIWLLRRSFHTACEEACDDWAVATGSNPIDLADTLTAWINRPKGTVSLIAIGMSSTKVRTVRLLRMRKSPDVRLSWACRWIGIPGVVLLVAGLAIAQSPSHETRPRRDGTGNVISSRSVDPPTNEGVPSHETTSTADQIENAIADDSLIVLYHQQIALSHNELDQIKSEPESDSSRNYSREVRDRIEDLKKRIEKRTSELRLRIARELTEESGNETQKSMARGDRKTITGPYMIEPPDILQIDPVQLVPRKPFRIAPFDKVKIVADPTTTKLENPISSTFQVDSSGEVVLGAAYGSVRISGLTRREAEEAVLIKLQETLKDPAVALTVDESRLDNGITGKHLVGPDGTINLGVYGQVKVAGRTLPDARKAVEEKLAASFTNPVVSLDVFAYNSKVYYVIVAGLGKGDGISRFAITGNERVLDAISQIGLSGISDAQVFIARPNLKGDDQILPVNWSKAMQGQSADDPQILPGDRVFITRAGDAPPQSAPPVPANTSSRQSKGSREKTGDSASSPPSEKNPAALPPYVIEPPDILKIEAAHLSPKEPYLIQPLDILKVDADPNNNTILDDKLYGPRAVEPGGILNLGSPYGKVKVSGLSLKEAEEKVIELLKKVYKAPKVSVTLYELGGQQQISGEHLVAPDGTINLGTYGQVYLSGLTIPKAKEAVDKQLSEYFKDPKVSVDIYAYNSKVYYVITQGAGNGENIQRFTVTGNETVLDAISQIRGLARLPGKDIWIARPSPTGVDQILPVAWDEITQGGGAATNYQILPGDRVYVGIAPPVQKIQPSPYALPEQRIRHPISEPESPEPRLSGTRKFPAEVTAPPTFPQPPTPRR